MNNATLQAPQAFSGVAIDPTTAWTLLVVVAVLSTLVGVVFIVAIVWTCMVCSGRTDVLSHQRYSRRDEYGRRNGNRFPPTHREMVEMGHIPSTNTMLGHHHPAISQDSGVSRGLGLRLSCPPDQVPHVPAPRSWTPSPPYELTKAYRRSQLGLKSKSQAQMQKVFENGEEGVHFCQSLPAQQISSCPRCSQHEKPRGCEGCSKVHCGTSRSPFNPRQNSPVSDTWSRGSIIRTPCKEGGGGIDNPVFEHSPDCNVAPSVQQHHKHHHHHHRHAKNDVIDKMAAEHSPLYASAAAAAAAVRNSPQLQDQIRKQEGASEMQLGKFLDIPHKPMQRHRSRIVLQPPGSAGSINVRHFVFSDLKKDDMDDTMDILLQNENQGPVACSSRQTTPQKKYQHQIYDANALSDFSASRSDPLVFERKHYNTPNNSLIESLKDPIETQVNIQSPGNNAEVFTEPVSCRKKNKILHATPYNVKKGAGVRNLGRFKSQPLVRTPFAYQRALSEIQLPPSLEGCNGTLFAPDIYAGGQKAQGSSTHRNHAPWSADFGLCMSCGTHGTLHQNLFNAKERATQTSWNSNSTIDNTQEMDPTPSMSWDHLTPDPSPVLGAPDESLENQEDFSQISNDTTQLVGNNSKVFEDTPQKCCTSLQCRVNTSKGTVNSSCSRNVSSQTEPDYSHTPQTSFRRNSTQIQPSISELRDMTSEVSPMVRGSPFIFVDSSIRVDSPQFVVDSTQLRVESPYHITDTPLSPFTDTKSYGTTSIALRLAHSPLGKNLPLYSPGSSRKSSSSTVSQNESPKKEFSNYCHHNSRNHRLHSPAYILLEDPEPSRITEANKQISQNYQQNNNDLHLDSKIPQRLSPTATHYLQITSPKDVSQNLHIATINNVPSKEIQTSSQTSGNNSCCITQQCEGESSPEVITAEAESSPRVITTDTLETLVTDDDI